MEKVKYFLSDDHQVSETELEQAIQEFHRKHPGQPFEFIKQSAGGIRSAVLVYSSPEAMLNWEVQRHQADLFNKYQEENRCFVCGEINCRYKNQQIHR